jgi:ATP-dependent Clp endopeptidase proteolytic subunit ClpP
MSYQMTNKGGECEIRLYDVIDSFWGISAKQIAQDLAAAGDVKTITVRINSPGGSVWDGLAIYNQLKSHAAKKRVIVDGLAASMASIVAMCGDEIEMPANAFMMIHNPADIVAGDADDMRKTAELLDQVKAQLAGIYAARCGQSVEAVAKLMDDETWMSGVDCFDGGFCTKVVDALSTAAMYDKQKLSAYKKIPGCGVPNPQSPVSLSPPAKGKKMPDTTPPAAPAIATLKQLKAACPGADEKFLVTQLEAEATVETAAAAWMTELQNRNQALQAELTAAKAKRPGVDPARPAAKKQGKQCDEDDKQGSSEDLTDLLDDDPIIHFDSLVTAEVKRQVALGKRPDRMAAVAAAANKHPQAHQAYLIACNGSSKRVKRLVEEKYDMMPAPPKK